MSEQRNLSDREQMFQAAELDNLQAIEYLVEEKNVGVDITDYTGRTPAHVAAMYGNVNVVKFLLQKNPSILNVNDKGQETLFMKAITYGRLTVVKYLVENWNISISERYDKRHFGNTPIHHATEVGKLDILKYFIEEKNGNVNIENDFRETPLFLATANKLYRIIQYLIEERGADATKINSKGYNVLFKAVEIDDLGYMKYLIDLRKIPFDLNWRGFLGETLAHCAVEFNRENVLLYLVSEKNVDINIADESGETPLHKAAAKDNYRVCRFLVDLGADTSIENEKGELPVHKASNGRLIRYLKSVGYDTRYPRSVPESFIPHLPAYSTSVRSERIAGETNTYSPTVGEFKSNSSELNASSLQFQNFLTVARAIIQNGKSIIRRPLVYDFPPSPQKIILDRIDPAAIVAVWKLPNFRGDSTHVASMLNMYSSYRAFRHDKKVDGI